MFGEYINEYTLDCSLWRILTGVVLFWLNVVLAAAAFAAMLWLCGKREQTGGRLPKLFLVLFYAVLMGGFYQLSAAEPFTCSMNYRYITPTCVIGAVFLGLAFQRLRNGKKPVCRWLSGIGWTLCGCFAACAAAFYIGLGLVS